jgi:flagellar biosynthesis/type III secretory pathway chaperone
VSTRKYPEADLERAAAHLLPAVAELEQALAAEADALRSHDAAALLSATETKRRCLRNADARLAQTRLWAGLGMGDSGNDDGLESGELPRWRELLVRLAHCRQMNQAAGAAIAALKRHTDANLRLLGLAPEPPSYGSSGRAEATRPVQRRAVC